MEAHEWDIKRWRLLRVKHLFRIVISKINFKESNIIIEEYLKQQNWDREKGRCMRNRDLHEAWERGIDAAEVEIIGGEGVEGSKGEEEGG